MPRKANAGSTKRPRGRSGRGEPAGSDLRTGSLAPDSAAPRSLEIRIGEEVRRIRKSLGLTLAELASAASLSAGMLSKIENGAISPSLDTLSALARSLNVPIAQFFIENDEPRDCSYVKRGAGVGSSGAERKRVISMICSGTAWAGT